MVTPAAMREAVAHLKESLEVSERRACSIIGADRSAVRYAAVRARLRELADLRRRFGYRRLHVLLRGEGHTLNRKKTQRLYREEGLAVRRRRSRRRIAVARTPIPKPTGPNRRWSTDFVHDQLADLNAWAEPRARALSHDRQRIHANIRRKAAGVDFGTDLTPASVGITASRTVSRRSRTFENAG
jgi:transposase InsO family protein